MTFLVDKIRAYYVLTKPGIIRGNLLTVAAGFFLASKGVIDWVLFGQVLLGTTFVIASACVANNYIDRSIDVKMDRTKKRSLVIGTIHPKSAVIFAIILGIIGVIFLLLTNILTLIIGLVAYVFYVIVYGLAKRATYHGTLVGTVSGALPPVAGYVSVTNNIDAAAVILFIILVLWQMPHFYAIAMYRRKDYADAHIPVISVEKGMYVAKRAIMWYILAFMMATVSLFITGYTGRTYLVSMLFVGGAWFVAGLRGFKTQADEKWARKMFFISLLVTLILSVVIAFNNVLA